MIKVNELRIGNWIIDVACGKIQVRGELLDEDLWRGENAMPIILTNEMLLACGFRFDERREKHETWVAAIFGEHPNFVIHNRQGYWRYSPIYNDFDTRIDHLHQLQNLYFALTGQELEYKP